MNAHGTRSVGVLLRPTPPPFRVPCPPSRQGPAIRRPTSRGGGHVFCVLPPRPTYNANTHAPPPPHRPPPRRRRHALHPPRAHLHRPGPPHRQGSLRSIARQ